jgi:hypothetical protein
MEVVSMVKLYKFHWYVRRMGDVEGIFAAEEADVEKAIGLRVQFGEILGKHSDIHGTLDREDLTVLTDDANFIAKAKAYGLIPVGHNPLDRLQCECGAILCEEECRPGCARLEAS